MTVFNLVVVALLAVSEILALIPSVGSNSIFQLVVSILRRFAPSKIFKRKEKVEEKKVSKKVAKKTKSKK